MPQRKGFLYWFFYSFISLVFLLIPYVLGCLTLNLLGANIEIMTGILDVYIFFTGFLVTVLLLFMLALIFFLTDRCMDSFYKTDTDIELKKQISLILGKNGEIDENDEELNKVFLLIYKLIDKEREVRNEE